MRIAHIDTGREMRGGQWQVLLLLRGLRERGHQSVLRAWPASPLFQRAQAEGFDVSGNRRSADIVHAHDARAHTMAVLWRTAPVVVSRRVAFPVRRSLASRWKYARANLFLAVSKHVRGKLVEAGIDESRVRVVYDGVPPLSPAPPTGLVVAPASADPMKGSDLARATGLDVVFSTDLQRDLPGAAAFLYLTREEGLGSALLLAMSAGVPVVASRVGGIPEVVLDGETGLLTANDPAQAAAKVRTLLDNPKLAERLAANGLHRYRAVFTVDQMVDRTLAAYRECVT